MKCTPDWPPRDPADKQQLRLALQILRERHRKGESAAAIMKGYSRPDEGLKLSTLKLFLKADHKGPVRSATRDALIAAGRRAWSRHCPLAVLHDQLAQTLLGPSARNDIEPFYGRYRCLNPRMDEEFKVDNHAAVVGPCGRCNRPLFQVRVGATNRCGFAFDVGTRLYLYIAERNYMRMLIVRCPDIPGTDPLVGILLAEDKDPSPRVAAVKTALIPEGSPWYGRADLERRMGELLVNELQDGVPNGILTGWRSLPPP